MAWVVTSAGNLAGGSLADFFAITDDGTQAVGKAVTAASATHPIRQPGQLTGSLWSTNGAMVDLGLPAGTTGGRAQAISQTGTVIAGFANYTVDNGNAHGVVNTGSWADLGGGLNQPAHPSQGGTAWGISADGTKPVGYYDVSTSDVTDGIVWTQSGGVVSSTKQIKPPTGATFMQASSISRDGLWVAGYYQNTRMIPFIWNSGTGVVSITPPVSPDPIQFPVYVSDGGTYIATCFRVSGVASAWRWSSATGWVNLGTLPNGTQAQANSITPDGKTVVGVADSNGTFFAFIWTAQTGMVQLPSISAGNASQANWVNSTATLVAGVAVNGASVQVAAVWSLSPAVPPGAPFNASLADLWFSPTTDFLDLSVTSNRRLFISNQAAPVSLGATGATPTGNRPPVFFSRAQGAAANTFATNLGNGGTFTLTGGNLADAATSPPCSLQVSTTTSPASKGVGVTGDYRNGNLYAFNMDTLTDNGSQRRWVRSWRAMKEGSSKAVRFDALRVDMETGAQVQVAGNPQIRLRYSDDGGHTWSTPRIMAVGALGQTAWNVRATRLGATGRNSASDRIFELASSDQFKVAIIGAEIDVG